MPHQIGKQYTQSREKLQIGSSLYEANSVGWYVGTYSEQLIVVHKVCAKIYFLKQLKHIGTTYNMHCMQRHYLSNI